MTVFTTSSAEERVAQLVADRDRHLRYLAVEFAGGVATHERDDVLQQACVRALRRCADCPVDVGHARHWFRRELERAAIDFIRARDGRRPSTREGRPVLVSLDTAGADSSDDEAPSIASSLASDEDTAEQVTEADANAYQRRQVRQALRALDARDRYVLHRLHHHGEAATTVGARYGLKRSASAELAVQARSRLLDALRAMRPTARCGEMRVLIAREPDVYLGADALHAHVSECLACRAFRARVQGALAVMPAPLVGPSVLRAQSALHTLVSRIGLLAGDGNVGEGLGSATAGAGLAAAGKVAAVVLTAGAMTAGGVITVAHREHPHTHRARTTRAVAAFGRTSPSDARIVALRRDLRAGELLSAGGDARMHRRAAISRDRQASHSKSPADELKPPGREPSTTTLAGSASRPPVARSQSASTSASDFSSGEFAPHP
jgi:RNA polymerase sigma factor (sigma-70 family)